MSHMKIIACDCLLLKFKETTQEICLNESKEFAGCCSKDTYGNHKLFCTFVLRVSISQKIFVIVNEWVLTKSAAPVKTRSTQLTENGQSFVF